MYELRFATCTKESRLESVCGVHLAKLVIRSQTCKPGGHAARSTQSPNPPRLRVWLRRACLCIFVSFLSLPRRSSLTSVPSSRLDQHGPSPRALGRLEARDVPLTAWDTRAGTRRNGACASPPRTPPPCAPTSQPPEGAGDAASTSAEWASARACCP